METKEREYADGVEIEINSVEVNTSFQNPEQVMKVRFCAASGDVTFKPKVERTENRKGLLLKRQEPCLIDDLPPFVTELAAMVQEKGNVKVKAHYSIWNATKDGQAVVYRFVQGNKMMDKWQVVAEEIKEEVIR